MSTALRPFHAYRLPVGLLVVGGDDALTIKSPGDIQAIERLCERAPDGSWRSRIEGDLDGVSLPAAVRDQLLVHPAPTFDVEPVTAVAIIVGAGLMPGIVDSPLLRRSVIASGNAVRERPGGHPGEHGDTHGAGRRVVVHHADTVDLGGVMEAWGSLGRSRDVLVISTMIRGQHVVIGPCIPSEGTPCPNCFFTAWQRMDDMRSGKSFGWLEIMRSTAEAGVRLGPTVELTPARRGLVTFHLERRLAALLNFFASPRTVPTPSGIALCDLETGEMREEVLLHSLLCSCGGHADASEVAG